MSFQGGGGGSASAGAGFNGVGGGRPNPFAHDPLPPLFSIHRGTVVRLQSFGAFVSMEGFRKHGLLHIGRISADGSRVERVEDVLREGQQVWVKVVQVDQAQGKLGLSMRDVDQSSGADLNPSESVGSAPSATSAGVGMGGGGGGFGGAPAELPALYSIHRARVARIQPFGAFADILPASVGSGSAGAPSGGGRNRSTQGLIHISQMSSSRRVENVEDVLALGEECWVKVVKIENGKVGLSLRDVDQSNGADLDPANSGPQRGGGGGGGGGGSHLPPPLYSIHRGTVAKLAEFGCFVELVGYRKHGLVHISQLASFKVDSVDKAVSVGESVWVKVTKVEEDGAKIGLSMKTVNQQTGADLDPTHVNAEADSARSHRSAAFEGSKSGSGGGGPIQLGAVHNVDCTRCGAHGHLAVDCLAAAGTRYDRQSDQAEEEAQRHAQTATAAAEREAMAQAAHKSASMAKIQEALRIIAETKEAKRARKEAKKAKKAAKEAKKKKSKGSSSSKKKSSRSSRRSRSRSPSSGSSDSSRSRSRSPRR